MKIKSIVCSSVGRKRKINQDNFYVNGCINSKQKKSVLKSFLKSEKEQLFAICDGMGGESSGEIASYIAVKKLDGYRNKYSNLYERIEEHIDTYVKLSNREICKYITEHDNRQMGSTLALLYIEPNKKEAVSANVGDSKIYIYRDGELKKISQDHNQAQSLVELGVITYEQALRHKSKSKLTQHLGIFPNELVIEPFISDAIMLKKGDIFLMCSDGLTDMLTEETIKELLSLKITLKKKAFKMVKEANKCGGNDNITVIIAMVK